ncbi:hypothetical protein [Protofrankia symbiont of Coriaria ruscifolia]|uniref:Uncharacterized protein n=1 Tax=Candidatus Protofrankia californiensis TaxID=1839754 RepID=A0A1C3PBV2_9ACTN|nr:hypothetical protein [Protofrankia symbiont of Coriaria ruscifolia]SBW27294.1 hypothetical protein FDG2_5261 [Candidatus Protofrankia californiensis]
MTTRRKTLPPPTGDDLTDLLRRRREQDQTPALAPAASRPARASTDMDRRSWYMRKDTADALAAVVDDIHFATRASKHVVLSVLIDIATERHAEALARVQAIQGQSDSK